MGGRAWFTPEEITVWIKLFITDNGYAPCSSELALAFGVTKSAARKYLLRAEEHGYIRRGKGIRNLTVNEERLVA